MLSKELPEFLPNVVIAFGCSAEADKTLLPKKLCTWLIKLELNGKLPPQKLASVVLRDAKQAAG